MPASAQRSRTPGNHAGGNVSLQFPTAWIDTPMRAAIRFPPRARLMSAAFMTPPCYTNSVTFQYPKCVNASPIVVRYA